MVTFTQIVEHYHNEVISLYHLSFLFIQKEHQGIKTLWNSVISDSCDNALSRSTGNNTIMWLINHSTHMGSDLLVLVLSLQGPSILIWRCSLSLLLTCSTTPGCGNQNVTASSDRSTMWDIPLNTDRRIKAVTTSNSISEVEQFGLPTTCPWQPWRRVWEGCSDLVWHNSPWSHNLKNHPNTAHWHNR